MHPHKFSLFSLCFESIYANTLLISSSVNLEARILSISEKSRHSHALSLTPDDRMALAVVDGCSHLSNFPLDIAMANRTRDGAARYLATCTNAEYGKPDI